jgi:GWxTD domain-containing protein
MRKAMSFVLAAMMMAAVVSCSRFPEPKNLDPESREFYSKVRYIITKEERDAFLRILPADRAQFIKEFWERRDPTPGTEENEFKDEYFGRIETANRLFREGSTAGWLQERGRVYITLGPPDNRETYPRGVTFYGKPQEIWWYGYFPVIFIDDNWSGNYTLTPLGAQHITEINRAQSAERQRGDGRHSETPPSVDYEVAVEMVDGKPQVVVTLPYRAIWFKSEGDLFKTTLEVQLVVAGRDGQPVWETRKSFDISVPRLEGLQRFEELYEMRIEADVPPGEYRLTVEVSNSTGGGKSKRSLDIKI